MHGKDPKELREEQIAQVRLRLARMGVDTSGASDLDVGQMMQQRAAKFRDDAPLTAPQAATIILDGVRRNEWRILVGDDATLLDQMVREDPTGAYEPEFAARVQSRGTLGGITQPRN